jgi:hypothetical protein
MIEEREYKGKWWLPDKPEEKISGTLSIIPNEGAFLNLTGTFKEIQDREIRNRHIRNISIRCSEWFNLAIILGISSDGENITLHQCLEREIKGDLFAPELIESSFFTSQVFVGVHFNKKEDIKFKELSVYYSYLDKWINTSGFYVQHVKDEVTYKYKLPESIPATINDNLKVLIDFQATYPTNSFVQDDLEIIQRTYIRIQPSEKSSFDEFLKIMYHLQNFLSLGVMRPVYPLTIEGITGVNTEINEDNTNTYYTSVKIFYLRRERLEVSNTIHPFMMFFTFQDISDKFEYFINNWFKNVDSLGPIYALYFGTLYSSNMYLEQQFLSYTQAIESYHRKFMVENFRTKMNTSTENCMKVLFYKFQEILMMIIKDD